MAHTGSKEGQGLTIHHLGPRHSYTHVVSQGLAVGRPGGVGYHAHPTITHSFSPFLPSLLTPSLCATSSGSEVAVDRKEGRRILVVPFRNSIQGAVQETLHALAHMHHLQRRPSFPRCRLRIIGSHTILIEHCLVVHPQSPICLPPLQTSIDAAPDLTTAGNTKPPVIPEKIVSHIQALQQCSDFLPSVPREESTSTSAAAKSLLDQGGLMGDDQGLMVAAICNRQCAEAYGLQIVAKGIQNQSQNQTEFLILTDDPEMTPADLSLSGRSIDPEVHAYLTISTAVPGTVSELRDTLASSGWNVLRQYSSTPSGNPSDPLVEAESSTRLTIIHLLMENKELAMLDEDRIRSDLLELGPSLSQSAEMYMVVHGIWRSSPTDPSP